MPDDVEEVDPHRPGATVDERADHVVGVLLADPDAVRRYHTVQQLQSGRLREIQAVSLRQLEMEHGSTAAAADAVGVTRQAAGALLGKAAAPTHAAIRDTPAYQYGLYLATAHALAAAQARPSREKAIMRWYDLEAKAPQTLTMLPAVAEHAAKWLHSLRVNRRRTAGSALALERDLDNAADAIAEWVASRKDRPRLTAEEQFAVYVGLAAGRRRKEPSAG